MTTPYKYVIAIILTATLGEASFLLGKSTAGLEFTYDWCGVSRDCDWYDKMLFAYLPSRNCTVESPDRTTTRMNCAD
jgi:hypothetical protein